MKVKRLCTLALAAVLAFAFAACGVANFDDSGEWSFEDSSASQADSSSGPSYERKQELNAQLTALVDSYNEGSEEFAAAIDDEVELPKDLSKDYDDLAPNIEELQTYLMENANEMSEDDADRFERDVTNLQTQVDTMRESLQKAITEHAEKPDSSGVTSG